MSLSSVVPTRKQRYVKGWCRSSSTRCSGCSLQNEAVSELAGLGSVETVFGSVRQSGSIAESVNGRGLGDTVRRASKAVYDLFAVIQLGEIAVVRATQKADIFRAVVATASVGLDMVELESFGFSAAAARRIHKATPASVTLIHRTLDWSRNGAGEADVSVSSRLFRGVFVLP